MAYEAQFRAISGAFYGKEVIDSGGKIILPNSAMLTMAHLTVSYPMLFRVTSSRGRRTHCGVLEFTAEEGQVLMPYWMMELLGVQVGEIVTIRSVSLPKGKFVKLRPQTQDFIKTSNPKAVLEHALTSFSCLTLGDTIPIHYNSRTYLIDIREVKAVTPSCPDNAICIVEADVEVDFERPLDMPDSPTHAGAPVSKTGRVSPPPGGSGGIVFGTNTQPKQPTTGGTPAVPVPQGPTAFSGAGRSMSGKVQPSQSGPAPTTPPLAQASPAVVGTTGRSLSGKVQPPTASGPVPAPTTPPVVQGPTGGAGRSLSGKVHALAQSGAAPTPTPGGNTNPPANEGEFVAFGGAGRSLNGKTQK